jgi:hypothetical protein
LVLKKIGTIYPTEQRCLFLKLGIFQQLFTKPEQQIFLSKILFAFDFIFENNFQLLINKNLFSKICKINVENYKKINSVFKRPMFIVFKYN